MHRAIRGGASVLAAAKQEVVEYGQGEHASDEAAVDYLRRRYQREADSIATVVTTLDRIYAHQRELQAHVNSVAELQLAGSSAVSAPIRIWRDTFTAFAHRPTPDLGLVGYFV